MPITITPAVADIDIGSDILTNSDWEQDTPATLSLLVNFLAGTQVALAATTGSLVKAISGNTTLSSPEAINLNFIFTGAISSVATITFPGGERTCTIVNNTTGGFGLLIGYATGTKAAIPAGGSAQVYGDGTNFKLASGVAAGSGGAVAVPGAFSATGAASLASTLAVTGAATFASTVAITGTLGVTGATTLSSTLSVTGIGTFLANVGVAGELNVQLDSAFLQDLGVGGNLGVSLDILCTGDIQGTNVAARHASLSVYLQADSTDGVFAMTEYASDGVPEWRIGKTVANDLEFHWFSGGVYQNSPMIFDSATGYLMLPTLPTSASGLASGTVWRNSGVLTVV